MAAILDLMILSKEHNYITSKLLFQTQKNLAHTRIEDVYIDQGTYTRNTQNTLHFKQLWCTFKSMFRKGHFVKIWITVLIKNYKPNSNLLSVVHTLHMHSLILLDVSILTRATHGLLS